MTLLLGILTFFVILAVLILVHELGHFTMAKLFRVQVEEFGLGFPPRLKSWSRGGTIYSLNALPLGGFVRMTGENGEDEEPDSFGAKPPWQRLIILLAGPSMNILLALTVFFVVFMIGAPRTTTQVIKVLPGSPAAKAGLESGDVIVAVARHPVRYIEDLQAITARYLGKRVLVEINRGSDDIYTSMVLRRHPSANKGAMGVELGRTTTVSYGAGPSFRMAVDQVTTMAATIPLLIQTISHQGSGAVAGPIGIAHITTEVVHNEPQRGLGSIFELAALLSANLGVLNLLPIPALDGGRIVFVLLSWIRRRNLDPQLEGLIHMAGMAVLLLLILLISYQDVIKWVGGGT